MVPNFASFSKNIQINVFRGSSHYRKFRLEKSFRPHILHQIWMGFSLVHVRLKLWKICRFRNCVSEPYARRRVGSLRFRLTNLHPSPTHLRKCCSKAAFQAAQLTTICWTLCWLPNIRIACFHISGTHSMHGRPRRRTYRSVAGCNVPGMKEEIFRGCPSGARATFPKSWSCRFRKVAQNCPLGAFIYFARDNFKKETSNILIN